VRLVSITQELGDDPMSNMIRQIMALFDEYQSKENAKHTLRAMKENARQSFWNGALLRTLVAASSAKTAGFCVPSFVPKWRARQDSNL
jgi:DNA invertase Pin-like site-specific DNA recombinase